MRVLLFGAGASFNAGYPLAGSLINEIEREAHNSVVDNLSKAWNEWQKLRDGSSGLARYLLRNSNPEVVLSLPDLCEVAKESEDDQAWRRVSKICSGKASDESDDVWKHLKSKERALASEAVAARDRFRYCLNHFFLYKHHLDSKPENRHRRDYLKRVLSPLSAGDRVITLNWDTTAERSLLEHDRWNPMNGYGFRHDLRRPSSYGAPTRPLDFEVLESEVVVLKLHGSVGWHQTRDGRFYFENRYGFLRDFKYTHRGTLIPLTNPEPNQSDRLTGFCSATLLS
jgi:hypothetical protein